MRAVEVDTAGEDVRTRQTLEAQLGSVGTAADRFYAWWNAALLHRSEHDINDVHVRINLLLHIIVLVVDNRLYGSVAILLVHLVHAVLDEILAVFKLVAVVISDDVAEFCLLAAALDADEMVETLVAFSLLRSLVLRNHVLEFHSQSACIHHLSLGIARMNAHALDDDLGSGSIEVLVFQVAQVAAIYGVSPVAAKLLYVEMMCTHTDFLVRIETYADISVLDFVVVAQIAHSLYDFSDARLVVSTQQGSTVCHDDILSLVSLQLWESLNARDDARAQLDVVAVIVLDDARFYILSAGIRRCIHV